ncbi:unnamed protein product [Effrenium voratum]|nr:unnamed protein product [Effrenium voratum]
MTCFFAQKLGPAVVQRKQVQTTKVGGGMFETVLLSSGHASSEAPQPARHSAPARAKPKPSSCRGTSPVRTAPGAKPPFEAAAVKAGSAQLPLGFARKAVPLVRPPGVVSPRYAPAPRPVSGRPAGSKSWQPMKAAKP